jgi:SAM-dependent methyltransferase
VNGVTTAGSFAEHTCTAPPERSDRMRDIVLAHVPADRAIRVLDLGCGTGSLLFRLADALPQATLLGIDVSPATVLAARQEQEQRAIAPRVRFEVADYLQHHAGAFDAIVSDGVLHLIPGDTGSLVRKLAADLNTGGVFVCAMPFECAYNSAFAVLRGALRRIRSPWLDRLILVAGRLLHGREMNDAGLRERVGYMYIPPERVMDASLRRAFDSAGLQQVGEYEMKSVSLSQLKHRVTVFTRRSEAR